MADAILNGVVQKIIEMSGSSTLKYLGPFWCIGDDLKKLSNTVLTIQAVLQDAEEQQVQNHQVKHWLNRLNRLSDVVYDADDLLSKISTRSLQQKVTIKKVRFFFSISNPLIAGHKMARKIKVIGEGVYDIARDMNNFRLVTETVTMGMFQSAMLNCANWVWNGTILDSPVYKSETDVSSVFNDSPPIFSRSNFIMSIYSPARSETDSSENYENFPNPYEMSVFSPARSQSDISENYENFPNLSEMSIFSPAVSETGS